MKTKLLLLKTGIKNNESRIIVTFIILSCLYFSNDWLVKSVMAKYPPYAVGQCFEIQISKNRKLKLLVVDNNRETRSSELVIDNGQFRFPYRMKYSEIRELETKGVPCE